MSHSRWRRWGLLLLVVPLGCAGVRVSTDYDPSVDFSRFHTYAWIPDRPPRTGDFRLDNPLLEGRVRDAVEKELAARGYDQVAENPDLLVAYHLSLRTELDVTSINDYYGYGGPWRGPGGWRGLGVQSTVVRTYETGTLVLDLIDAQANELVWRGVGEGTVKESATPEESAQRIREAVAAILDRFPPQPEP